MGHESTLCDLLLLGAAVPSAGQVGSVCPAAIVCCCCYNLLHVVTKCN